MTATHPTPRPIRLLSGIVLALLFVTAAAWGITTPMQPETGMTPLPFDPPGEEEKQLAVQIALADPRIQADLTDRHVLVGVALGTQKEPGVAVQDLTRLIDVWFYEYSTDIVVWAVVDPARAEVTKRVPVDFPYQPPLAAAEIERARELALALDDVRTKFPDPLPVTAMLASGEGTPCPVNRCVVLAFVEGAPHMDLLVLVNLSEDRVVRILDGPAEVYA